MSNADANTVVRLPSVPTGAEGAFLVVGGQAPTFAGANLHGRPGSPFAGIILIAQVEPGELAAILDRAPDPAVPIADFGNNGAVRRDFVGSALTLASLDELTSRFAPIQRRLAAIPFRSGRESRAAMTVLRLAYSRETEIKASFAPESRRLVEYPLLGVLPGARSELEMLANLQLLRRRHFARTHTCSKCESARMHAYEACPGCGGADLKEETLVHHYRCGCQEVESHFRQGDLLVCPKCRRVLHHLGTDYGKPGTALVCATCGDTNSEPAVAFVCLDCTAPTPASDAATTDWYHYSLASDGLLTLREGRLPQFNIASMIGRRTHAYTMPEFRLLVEHEIALSANFNLPFLVTRVSGVNTEDYIRKVGPVATEADFQRSVNALVASLRKTDFIGVGADLSFVIGFPGTSRKELDLILHNIQRTIDANTSSSIELNIEVFEGGMLLDMFRRD